MMVLIVLTMTAALVAMGAVMLGVLQRHLIGQLDTQLESTAQELADSVANSEFYGQAPIIPTDYYIRSTFAGQPAKTFLTPETMEKAGAPVLSKLDNLRTLPVTAKGMTAPMTVGSTLHGARWRIVAIPMQSTTTNQTAGVVTVGLPLVDISETMLSTGISLLVASAAIIGIGSIVGYLLVSKSLQPLQQIKSVAEEIAAGDLSQRIPPLPSQTEVGSLASSLNKMLTQIETSFNAQVQSERKIKRFVSDASHELRTPLAAIRGYAELYRMGAVEETQIDDVMMRIESESRRMGTLVSDLLTLARLDEGQPLELSEVDLAELARNAQGDLQALDPSRKVEVEDLDGRPLNQAVIITADRDKLTQVLVNLVGNVNQYTPAGSPVQIRVGVVGDRVVVQIRDHGPGITADEQRRVFERFYRTDKSRSREKGGSGLGLAIVSGIVQAHQGEVQMKATPGGGLTVHIELKSLPKGVS